MLLITQNSNLKDMGEKEKSKLIARLRRLSGQAASLERLYIEGDKARFTVQLEATIAAGRATLAYFAEHELVDSESLSDKKLLARLIRKP